MGSSVGDLITWGLFALQLLALVLMGWGLTIMFKDAWRRPDRKARLKELCWSARCRRTRREWAN
jgi:hypothetical protein